MRSNSKPIISEAKLRKIIREELTRQYIVQEGLAADAKQGIVKLTKAVKDKIKGKAKDLAAKISEAMSSFKDMPDELKTLVDAIKKGMKESGESLKLDDTLKDAKKFGSTDFKAEAEADFQNLKDNAASLATAKTESLLKLNSLLLVEDTSIEKSLLSESVIGLVGIGLGTLGFLPMLFAALGKVASWLKCPKIASAMEKSEHFFHKLEEKVIDYIVPDKLSYKVYLALQDTPFSSGLKLSAGDDIISFEDYTSDKAKAYEKPGKESNHSRSVRSKVDGLIYKGLLVFFLWQGIQGVLHSGASILGILEGGASAVKGIELAAAAEEIAVAARAAV
jgi:hypothetical protein